VKKLGALRIAIAASAAVLLFSPAATASAGPAGPSARTTGIAKALNGKRVTVKLKAGVSRLITRAERPAGYERDKFKLWVDIDHDCQDARSEVLRQESKRRVTGRCAAKTGLWFSYYDHTRFTRASKLDIDHVVPLAEVWRSGGRSWSSAKRAAYANDLTDRRTLIAVSAHANRSKGDRDPSQWLPEYGECRYVSAWIAVKLRWGLSVDALEAATLKDVAATCGNPTITTHLARVTTIVSPSKTKHHTGGSSGSSHACTRTSTGSCIRGGSFCPQASYGQVGYDANGNRYVCTGDRTHPHWM